MILFSIFLAGALAACAAYYLRTRRVAAAPAAGRGGPSAKSTRAHARSGAASATERTAATARTAELKAPPFAAVEIRIGASACAAAQALGGQRFLASRAPSLPLRDCSEARCRCAFKKLSDRRLDSRRWSDDGISPRLFTAEERREMRDRRTTGDQ